MAMDVCTAKIVTFITVLFSTKSTLAKDTDGKNLANLIATDYLSATNLIFDG